MFLQLMSMPSCLFNQHNPKINSSQKSYLILATCFATQDYPNSMSFSNLQKQWIRLFAFIYWVLTSSFNEIIIFIYRKLYVYMEVIRAKGWVCIPLLSLTSYIPSLQYLNLFDPLFLQLKIVNNNIYLSRLCKIENIYIRRPKMRQSLWSNSFYTNKANAI